MNRQSKRGFSPSFSFLPYPNPDFLRGNTLDKDINPVYGYILPLFGEKQVPGIPLIAVCLFLHDGIDILRRHAGIDNMVFPSP
jgi:hypothetical protein